MLRPLAICAGTLALLMGSGCQRRDLSIGQNIGGGEPPTTGGNGGAGKDGPGGAAATATGGTTIGQGGVSAVGGGGGAAGVPAIATGGTATGGGGTTGTAGSAGATAAGGAGAGTSGGMGGMPRPVGAASFTPVSLASDVSTGYRLLVDVNGDGKLDLVATAFGDETGQGAGVHVLLGRGDGTFVAAVVYPLASARVISAGDLNGDGKPDLAISGASRQVEILLNKGDGTFTFAVPVSTQAAGERIQLADLNGDRKADLVTSAYSGVNVFLNMGEGTFGPGVSYSAPSFTMNLPVSFGLGDLNDDGRIDLVVSVDHREPMGLFLNAGDGTFGAAISLAYGVKVPVPRGIGITDMNGDGKADIVGVGSLSGGVSIFLNDRAGSFAPPLSFTTVTSLPTNMNGLVADFDGNGAPDLVIPTSTAGLNAGIGSVLLLNDGTGALVKSSVALPPFMAAVGDLNGDGKPDLVGMDQVFLNTNQ
ncbi:MAG: VCBS repeat-containing protein [Myxococcales bacterium]